MAIHYRTKGIILAKKDRGEADRVFTVYTKDFSKLALWATSERKIASKLRGGLQELSLSSIEFINGKSRKTITDARLDERYAFLRSSLVRLRVALRIAKTLDLAVPKEQEDRSVFALLQQCFCLLNNPEFPEHAAKFLYHYFFWHLFSLLGWAPNLALLPQKAQELLKPFLAQESSFLYTFKVEKEEGRQLHELAKSHYLSVIKEVQ